MEDCIFRTACSIFYCDEASPCIAVTILILGMEALFSQIISYISEKNQPGSPAKHSTGITRTMVKKSLLITTDCGVCSVLIFSDLMLLVYQP